MSEFDEYKRVDELGNLKDSRYWIKKDIETIKNAVIHVFKALPVWILVTLTLSTCITLFYNSEIYIKGIITYVIVLLPILFIGHLLVYVIINKGYNIYSYGGTMIDRSRLPNAKKNKSSK